MSAKSSFRDRISAAWEIVRNGYISNGTPIQKASRKSPPFAFPVSVDGVPQWTTYNFENFVDEGFDNNSVIYSAIMYKVKSVSLAPLRAYTGEEDKPEPLPRTHYLSKLVKRPNAGQSMRQLMGQSIAHLNIAGNAYVFFDRPGPTKPPTAMYNLRPDRVRVLPKKGGVAGFRYVPEGQSESNAINIPAEYIAHIKFPNPNDPYEGFGEGLSPIFPLAKSGDVDNYITEFLNRLFKRGTMAFGILKFDIPLDEKTIGRLRTEWDEMYGGVDQWGRPIVLDQGGSYERGTPDFDKLGFDAIDQRNEARMLGPFGVPAVLIGMRLGLENATYSNVEGLEKIFWQLTMEYELSLFEDAFEYALSEGDSFVKFDRSKVPALQKDIKELIAATKDLTSIGVPLNIASKKTGLDLEDIPGGDVGYLPFSVVPAMGKIPPKVVTPLTPPPEPPPQLPPGDQQPPPDDDSGGEGEGINQTNDDRQSAGRPRINRAKLIQRITGRPVKNAPWDDARALKVWTQQDIVTRTWERNYQMAAQEAFEADKREITALVYEEKTRAKRRKATMVWAAIEDAALAYLKSKSIENWRALFIPQISGLITDAGNYWAAELGFAFDVQNLLALEWFDEYTMQFASTISETSQAELSALLQQAMYEGWTVEQGLKNLDLLFAQWLNGNLTPEQFAWLAARMPAFRKEMIYLTETIRSYGAGTVNLFKLWGIKQKQWWAAEDERTCPFCLEKHGKVIGIDIDFASLGDVLEHINPDGSAESLKINYTNVGHPPLHVKCRCTVLPVF